MKHGDILRACFKRRFTSPHQARLAHRTAAFRVRVYWCADCAAYHAANADKRTG